MKTDKFSQQSKAIPANNLDVLFLPILNSYRSTCRFLPQSQPMPNKLLLIAAGESKLESEPSNNKNNDNLEFSISHQPTSGKVKEYLRFLPCPGYV